MTCHLYRDVVLDLERGVADATMTSAAAQAHAAGCPACRTWLEDQRRLSAGLRALAQATPSPPHDDMEARLGSAFDVYHAIASRPRRFGAWTRWAAAAAALGAVGVGIWQFRTVTVPGQTAAVANTGVGGLTSGASGTSPSTRAVAPAATAVVPAPPRPAVRPIRAATLPPFVPIPAAIGLPPLESAQVFRVRLSVEALPAYGFDIAPDATGSPVTADILVGQDGQPRAIRLVAREEQPGSTR